MFASTSTPASASSQAPSPARPHVLPGSAPLDPATQIQDIRILERNIANSVKSFRQLRRHNLCVVALLLASSAYWTWRLREKLTDAASRAPQEIHRLWLAWALLGIAPTVAFFIAMYQSIVVVPSRFIDRLNRSLVHFHVAYSAETGRLLCLSRQEPDPPFRQPFRLSTGRQRSRPIDR